MITDIIFILALILTLISFAHVFNFYNCKYIKKNVEDNYQPDCNFFSVIIPVRNEEKNILNLLNSIKNQSFKDYEVIIVDDYSVDDSIKVVKQFIEKGNYKNFKLLSLENLNNINNSGIDIKKEQIKELMNESIKKYSATNYYELIKNLETIEVKKAKGKSVACYIGSIFAESPFLLFMDADVRLESDALLYIYNFIKNNNEKRTILTIQPYHQIKKPYENFSMFFNLTAFIGLNLGKFSNPLETKLGYFGPLVIFDADFYRETGGHAQVLSSIIEDMDLGQKLVEKKAKIISIPHKKLICYRMYPENFKSLINGWTKNIFAGANRSTILTILLITGFFTCYSSIGFRTYISFVKFINGNLLFSMLYPLIIIYLSSSLLLFFTVRNIGRFNILFTLFYPILIIFYIYIFIRSFLFKILKIPVNWKGRKVIIK